MISLFSKGSLIVLESLSFTKTLYAFDFDGTLAKIVPRPEDAFMSRTTEGLLRELCELAPVAIVSGRGVADLKKRIPFSPKYVVGNHGLEGVGRAKNSMLEAQKICGRWKSRLLKVKFESGVEIEDKKFSLSLHFRRARNKSRARAQIQDSIDHLIPAPRVILGKSVVNLLSPGSPHKGAAILDLMKESGLKHVFYAGDDETDEDVFAMPYEAGQIMTVRVGIKRSSKASYFISRQSQINRLLKVILSHHRASR